jgi:hypothetical protein
VVSRAWLAGTVLWLMAAEAPAQEFGVYLACKGQVLVAGRKTSAHVDLALRRNNQTGLVQRSDLLPAGERFKFDITPAYYTLVVRAPLRSSPVYRVWVSGRVIVWARDLVQMRTARLSVDRQTGNLDGTLLDGASRTLGTLQMTCRPDNNESTPEPKF